MKKIKTLLMLVMAIVFSLLFSTLCVYADDVIEIRTVDDLYNVRNDLTANYKLMNDIDMTEATSPDGKYDNHGWGWEPIGSKSSDSYQSYANSFTGVFDGNGYAIIGLHIDFTNNKYESVGCEIGLFSSNAGTIKNLKLKDISYTLTQSGTALGGYYVGGIAGRNTTRDMNGVTYAGQISNCSVQGTIKACALVSDSSKKIGIGGITCENYSKVEQCYTDINYEKTGEYIDGIYVNGISGSSTYSYNAKYNVVMNCFSTSVDVKIAENGSVYSSYYPTETGGVYYDSNGSSYSMSKVKMTLPGTYSGFDFDNIWTIHDYAYYKYPQLQNNMKDLHGVVDTLEWKTTPTKVEYYTDEDIDVTGGVFTAYYLDDTHEDIELTSDMVSDYDRSKTGVQTVTVTFRGKTITFDIITSVRPEIDSMTLGSGPNQSEFVRGTAFDFTGAYAHVQYKNGTSENIPIKVSDTTGGNINTSGDQTITFARFGLSVSFQVKVVPVKAVALIIIKAPNKTTYIEGQEIDPAGLELELQYNNGTVQNVTDYTIEEYEKTVGTRNIVVTADGFSTSFPVEFKAKSLSSILVTSQPTKARYIVGEKFDKTGMVVKAAYDNGSSEVITEYTVSDITDTVGWQNLTVSYQGKTTTVKVYVVAKELVSISVSQMPLKTEYIEGEAFDPIGMVVIGNYNDTLQEEITGYTLSGTTLNKVGQKTITVLYEGVTTSFTVNVKAKTLTKITVTPPAKLEYIDGEDFDDTGMVVKAVYDNGKSETVSDYTVSGFGDDEEANTVIVSYGGKTAGFLVTIHTPETGWAVTTDPTCTAVGEKTLYCKNCQKVLDTAEIKANGHTWGSWEEVSSPNCTDKGSEKHTCSVCKLVEYQDVNPKGHTWEDEYTVDLYPSCTQEGSESIHCSVCGVSDPSRVKSIEKTPHDYGDWTTTKNPTCVEAGVKNRTCKDCPHVDTDTIPATGIHNYGDWHTTKAATCTQAGKKEHECSDCHDIEEAVIDAMGHNMTRHSANAATTAAAGNSEYWSCDRCEKYFSDDKGKTEISNSSWVIPKLAPPASAPAIAPAGPTEIQDLPAVKISKPQAGKKKVTVKWKKPNKKVLGQIQGIEIRVVGPGVDTTTTAGKKKTSKKVGGLTPKQKYTVQVRTYAYIGGVKHVSAWKSKSVKVK